MADVSRNPLRAGDIVSRTFSVWMKNAIAYGLLSILFGSPLLLVTILDPKAENSLLQVIGTLAGILTGLIVSGAVTYGVFQQLRGERAPLDRCLSVGLSRIVPILLAGILMFLVIAVGYVCLIIPGIILQLGLTVATPVAVVENPGAVESLRRSWALTRGSKLTIFLALIITFIAVAIMSFPVGVIVALTGDSVAVQLVVQVVQLFFGALGGVLGAVIYHDLRVMKEGAQTDVLARVFE